ncbi:MAG TPA: Gfo/Idh/MocA family oxidoreductase [Isosphaeraceae bacterium]|jgi:predicted dehydrogenase|nr:Gfo/Idh/MocA family oxidoreductase [Isosphaeraceae bacterium]
MATSVLRIGITGCGHAAHVHLRRLLGLKGVKVVGCADPDADAAQSLVAEVGALGSDHGPAASFADHRELLRQSALDALAIFTPHLAHYRPAMDALQAGCHVFVEKPLSTNVQEAVDIVGLARGRNRKVAVGHQYRLRPSLAEARRRLAAGSIGVLRLVVATLAQPWLESHQGSENSWRFDAKVAGGGILADVGDHLIDAVLWTTGQVAAEVAAFQNRIGSGLDVVTSAAIRLADGTPVTLALSGVSAGSLFELTFFGERGRLRATDETLVEENSEGARAVPLAETSESIDGNFIAALTAGVPLCCPAEEAVETVRLLEAIARSATTGEVVRLA